MCLLSVVIPCFNSERDIFKTINSLNHQSFKPFEVIFVDGGSSDKTTEIINMESQFKYFLISEPDQGIYDAMNKGIKHSSGEWLYFLGSDDVIYDNFVFEQVSKFFSNSDFIYGSIESNFFMRNKIILLEEPSVIRKKYNNAPPFFHQSVFIKREVINNIGGYNLNYQVHADFDLMIKAFQSSKKVSFCNLTIAKYNAEGFSGITIKTFRDNRREFREILLQNNSLDIFWRLRLLKNYIYLIIALIKGLLISTIKNDSR